MWIYTVHYQYVGFLHVCLEIVNHKFEVLMFQKFVNNYVSNSRSNETV